MYTQEFISTVPIGSSENVTTFDVAPGYNQYQQLCAAVAVHTWDEEYPLTQELDIMGDVVDSQPTVRAKYKPIDRTRKVHTPFVQHSEISDD